MTEDIYSNILKKLQEQEREEGKLPLLFEFYRRLVTAQSKAKKRISIPKQILSSKDIKERLQQGLPLLRFEDLALDWSLLREIFAEVVTVFAGFPELFGEPENARSVQLTSEAVKAWYEGTVLPESPCADENLALGMIQATMKPLLQSYSETLIGSVNQEGWRRRYCPICGGSPDFAFLDKELGSRWLICSRCDTRWVFQRLECPFCGNQSQDTLAYLSDDEGLYRLYVCERCKHYIKAIDLRQAKTEVLFPLERLTTIDLDSQAQKQGYLPYNTPTQQ